MKMELTKLSSWVCPSSYLLLLIACLLVACVPAELEPSFGGPVPVTREATPPPFPIPSETPTNPQPEVSVTRTPYVENDDGMLTTLTQPATGPIPTQTPVPPFPGLIYQIGNDLWRVGFDWQPELVAQELPGAVQAVDGQQALYQVDNDIWLVDLASGQELNLTVGQDRHHCCAQWWLGRPGTIIFGSWPVDDDTGPTTGFLSAVNRDGTDYRILDEEMQSNAVPAPGLDGQTIAYDRVGSSWLYRWDRGPEFLAPADFGLTNVVRIGGPSWSPDGRLLAWTVAIEDPDWQIALAVFDLNAGTARLLHPYQNIGRGGWFPPPAWSPDGRWITFGAEAIEPEANGIWVVAADGSEEIYLGPGVNPIWSPDNRWLTYASISEDSEQRALANLVEVDSWYPLKMYLEPGARVVDWVE